MPTFRRLLPCFMLAFVTAVPRLAHAQVERTRLDTTFAFTKGSWVDVGIASGEIVVTTWDRAEARVIARAERGNFESELSSTRIVLRQSRSHGSREVRYELTVPVGTKVQASASSGDIRIKGTAAEVQARTSSGGLEVTDAADRIEVGSTSGDIRLGKLRGRTRVTTASGDIEINDVVGDISVHTVSSEIKITNARSAQVRAESTSGEITYDGTIETNGNYEFSAHSGDVRIAIPAASNANLELQTFSGSIRSDFRMTMQPGDMDHRQRTKRFEFTIGSGGARITAGTFSGDITIERTGRSSKEN